MTLLYKFDEDKTEAIMKVLAQNCQKRRLEKGLSRDALADLSKVPAATIAKFETKHVISLVSFVALAKALGYTNDLKQLLSEPLYNTMAELDEINRNLNRKRGSRNVRKEKE